MMKKKMLISLLLLTAIFPVSVFYFEYDRIVNFFNPRSTDWYSLIEKEGLFYKKFSNKPYTGEVTGEKRGKMIKGQREGMWVYYWDNSKLSAKGNYKNNTKEGYWESYDMKGQSDRLAGTYRNGEKISD